MSEVNMIKVVNFENRQLHFRTTAGSHIPLLRNVTRFFDVKSIIEFGTGLYSLKTFLDRKYYPSLEKIYSYETGAVWSRYIKTMFNDSRWKTELLGESAEALGQVKFPKPVDLVFVDGLDSQRGTILRKYRFLSDVFILHDCDAPFFKDLLKEFKYQFIYAPPKPRFRHTAILSDKIDVSKMDWNIQWEEDFLKWI